MSLPARFAPNRRWVRRPRSHAVLQADRSRRVEPLVRPGHVRARRRGDLVRHDHPRSRVRLRRDPAEPRRRPDRRCGDPLDDRRLHGQPHRPRADDHDGRRPARDGPVLAADRAADPPGQAEPAGDRPLRRDLRACDPRAPRGDRPRRRHRPGPGDRGRDGVRARPRQHRGARPLRPPHRAVAPRLVADRARRQGHAQADRAQVPGSGGRRGAGARLAQGRASREVGCHHRDRVRRSRRGGRASGLRAGARPGARRVRAGRGAALPSARGARRSRRGKTADVADLPARADARGGRRLRRPPPRRYRRALARRLAVPGSDHRRSGDRPPARHSETARAEAVPGRPPSRRGGHGPAHRSLDELGGICPARVRRDPHGGGGVASGLPAAQGRPPGSQGDRSTGSNRGPRSNSSSCSSPRPRARWTDERDVEMALREDREGIGAAAGADRARA